MRLIVPQVSQFFLSLDQSFELHHHHQQSKTGNVSIVFRLIRKHTPQDRYTHGHTYFGAQMNMANGEPKKIWKVYEKLRPGIFKQLRPLIPG